MTPIRRGSGNQYLHRKSQQYRQAVHRKLQAYERHIQIGLIAQGLLHYLALKFPRLIWRNCGAYLRTANTAGTPSEWVVTMALRQTWNDFLQFLPATNSFKKFLATRVHPQRNRNSEIFDLEQAA